MPYPAWLGGGITGGGACPWGGWAPNPPIQAAEGDWLGRKKKKSSANAKKNLSIQLYKSQAEPNHKQEINILKTESKEINHIYPYMQNIYFNISLKFLLRSI